jgi:Flp pilus assembly protein TadG
MIGERDGSVAVITALLLPLLVGFFALALEPAFWMQVQRGAQNAADSAVLAAAINGGAAYAAEAEAVAAQYGLVDGQNNVSIQVAENVSCPAAAGGGTTCYSVTITKTVPLLLASAVGYRGDTTLQGALAKSIVATAVSIQGTVDRPYCILALAGSGAQGIRTNGAPNANLAGCNIMSNTTATCNGHNLGADVGDAHGSNNGCGVQTNSNQPVVTDPYANLAANIPSNPCSSYPQEPTGKKGAPLPPTNTFSGAVAWTGAKIVCGDMQLTGDVTLNTAATGAVLVIENGQLDTNGHTIQTASGAAVTIVFSGDNGSYTHAPTGGGTIDIAAPTSGAWSGVAIYQDPGLTSGVDISATGNSPTWDITGLVYLPHSSVTFSGAVNKSSNGASCFDLVVDNLLINGTGSILAHGQCGAAGLAMPAGKVPGRGKLVK